MSRGKWGTTRSSNGGSGKASEVIGARGGSYGGEQWCAVRVNPNRPHGTSPFYTPPSTPSKPSWARTASWAIRPGCLK
jgi:hypothetical protein